MAKQGRGWKSKIELLPKECSPIVVWAANELQTTARTQQDIYEEFVVRLEAVKREQRGELEFDIPSFSGFNRYSTQIAATTRELSETREMAKIVASNLNVDESDDLTLIVAESIKAVVFHLVTGGKKNSMGAKDLKALAEALKAASNAQSVSTTRRQKVQKEFKDKVDQAVELMDQQAEKLTPDGKEALRKIREDVYGIFK